MLFAMPGCWVPLLSGNPYSIPCIRGSIAVVCVLVVEPPPPPSPLIADVATPPATATPAAATAAHDIILLLEVSVTRCPTENARRLARSVPPPVFRDRSRSLRESWSTPCLRGR